ncbi:hypothetical protein NQD34_003252 [Periophthalmus magnuspinnatus]|nr:hypothetical protein NQD34_003252 [Periophthalmus magnuspinnatus]
MDKAFVYKDLKSFECSSPSELDRKFFEEQSLLSALSLDQLSTSRVSNEYVANSGSNTRLSILASLSTSLEPISPSPVLSVSSINEPDTDVCYLNVPLQGKSSTPQLFLTKQEKTTSCDRSYSDLVGSQISWDVSIIKSESPKVTMELSASESAWSPKQPPSQQPDPRLSP